MTFQRWTALTIGAAAFCLAGVAVADTGTADAGASAPAGASDEVSCLDEKRYVTGSRIMRSSRNSSSSPVYVHDPDDAAAVGATDVSELMARTPGRSREAQRKRECAEVEGDSQ